MLSFKNFISEQKLRQGLEHLSKLDHSSLGELLKTGTLSGSSTRKTDGAAGEVGYDENGFYTRSARSDKIRNPGEYSAYTRNKRGEDADTSISDQYDDMHHKLQNNKALVNYLKSKHEAGQPASVKGEFFLRGLGQQTDKGIKFVNTSYNPAAMGHSGMFIMHHKLPENSCHDPNHIATLGDKHVTFDHDRSENSDFNIDASDESKLYSTINPDVLKSRKAEHKDYRSQEEEKLARIKSSLEKKLANHTANIKPRPWEVAGESEGDVFHTDTGRFKIQSPQFKEFKAKQKEEGNVKV
jgi:hypothetical protein